jgi:hypothetical protein
VTFFNDDIVTPRTSDCLCLGRPAHHSAFSFSLLGVQALDSRFLLQSRRWYCSLGSTCSLRSRSGMVWQIVATRGEFQELGDIFLMLDLDGELRLDMFRKGVYKD